MTYINMLDTVGDFGEDKDAAAFMRNTDLRPSLERGETVTLDFANVHLVTQSFVHALISDVLRKFGENVLDQLDFKNCDEGVKGIISTVVQYSLDTMDLDR